MDETTSTDGKTLKTPVALDRVLEMDETRQVRPLDHPHAFLMSMAISDLPPIDVVRLRGHTFGVLAGYHRLEAHRLAGARTIKVTIHDLDPEEYHAFAVRSNVTHGRPLTLSERKANARLIIFDHPDWSAREIGRCCGLDHKTIAKLREPEPEPEPEETGGEIPIPTRELPFTHGGTDGAFDEMLDDITEGIPSPKDIPTGVGELFDPIGDYADAVEAAADPPAISKPDFGGGVSHPARYTQSILTMIRLLLECHVGSGDFGVGKPRVLDQFAGTGRIHDLNRASDRLHDDGWDIIGVELEPEWAGLHPDTIVGNALHLPFEDASFDAIVTSPCYGNRLADHHHASDPESRRSYTHDLGRDLSPDNAGALQWGPEYREFHEQAWKEAARVLNPGGCFVLNIKDHTRDGLRQFVAGWHVTTLCRLGFTLLEHVEVATPSLRVGDNSDARWPEEIYVLRFDKEPGE
jgi:SAM-dependent methyltransferase